MNVYVMFSSPSHSLHAVSVVPRVYRISRVSRSNVRLQVSNDYFAFLEEELRIYCYCRNESKYACMSINLLEDVK